MWKKRQIVYAEQSSELRISVRARRENPLVYTFLAIWLCGWTAFGIKGLKELFDNPPSDLPLWPLGWAFGEVIMVGLALFLSGGREVITINRDFVKGRRQIFGIGFTREYFLNEVLSLRYQLPMHRCPGRLIFDYEGRTVRLVSNVDGAEAVELLSRIRQEMRRYGASEAASGRV